MTRLVLLFALSVEACTGTLVELGDPDGGGAPSPPRVDGGDLNPDAGEGNDARELDAGDGGLRLDAGSAELDGGQERADVGGEGGDGGRGSPCDDVVCGANALCEESSGECTCAEGFVAGEYGNCLAPLPGDPAGRSREDVCSAWHEGHLESASTWVAGDAACDPGRLSRAGVDDVLRRVNLFRWLAGLGPVTHDADAEASWMECAWMMEVNGRLSHNPPATWDCYTEGGARAAGRSNLGRGYRSGAEAVDGFMADASTTSLGHRRWILGSHLRHVQVGVAGRGMCLGVFDGGGRTDREWSAYPNPGFAPLETARFTWSFQSYSVGLTTSTSVEVVRASDGATLPVESYLTGGGGPPPTLAFQPSGWRAEAGESYEVRVRDTSSGDIVYEVKPVGC